MTFKRLLSYLKPHKKLLIFIIIITTISSIISILAPKILGDFITTIYESAANSKSFNNNHLYNLLILLSTLYLTNIIFNYLETYLTNTLAQKTTYTLRNKANEKILKLPNSYFESHSKGELISRFNNDLEATSIIYMHFIPKTINYLATFLGTLIMMLYIDSLITLLTLIVLPIITISSKLLLKFSKKKRTQYFEKLGYLNAITTEAYLNQEIVSLYNKGELMCESFNKLNNDLAKTHIKANLITSLLSPVSIFVNYIIYLMVLLLGAKHVIEGKLKFGDIQALIQYTKQIGNPINNASSFISQMQTSIIASKRIFELLDEKEEEFSGNLPLSEIENIEFKNVEFSYSNLPLIKDLNLKINKGEKIAIVGETGSGKSTLINLLMQFYKIQNGDILINNKSIYDYNINNYYSQLSLVTQDLWLLNDTIESNLKYANRSTNEEELKNICLKTNSLNFIEKTPEKFNTIIDDNNQIISEGEKQLLTIARGLIKNHRLLILDEATSNVDAKTEKLIEETLDNINHNQITIIIAHRLSTITKADKIIVMKNGKIIEVGTHQDLYKERRIL